MIAASQLPPTPCKIPPTARHARARPLTAFIAFIFVLDANAQKMLRFRRTWGRLASRGAFWHCHHTGNEGHGAHDSVSCVPRHENSQRARDRVVRSGGSVQGVLPKSRTAAVSVLRPAAAVENQQYCSNSQMPRSASSQFFSCFWVWATRPQDAPNGSYFSISAFQLFPYSPVVA